MIYGRLVVPAILLLAAAATLALVFDYSLGDILDLQTGKLAIITSVNCSPVCTQTDGGIDIYARGTNTYYAPVGDTCTRFTVSDYCTNSGTLFEYSSCGTGQIIHCSGNCSNGACVVDSSVAEYLSDKATVKFLIITVYGFLDEAALLASKRTSEGITTMIKDVREIPPPNSILGWLSSFKTTHPQLEYVLLLGDSDKIPTFYSSSNLALLKTPTDLKYALPQNNLPTLAVGRIPAQSDLQVRRWFSKLESYEKYNPPLDVLLFGRSKEYDGYAATHSALITTNGFTTLTMRPQSARELIIKINGGIGFSIFYGHGTTLSFAPVLDTSHLYMFNNKYRPTIFFSGGCDTVNFVLGVCSVSAGGDASCERSISEQLLMGNHGAAAVLGATRYGGYGYDYTFVPSFFKNCTGQRLGKAFNRALKDSYDAAVAAIGQPASTVTQQSANYFVEKMVLLGDPTMKVCEP